MVSPLRFYNSDGRTLQTFVPRDKNKVSLYCCGPTVYNYAHIGNLRAYLCWDILRRSLEWFGYKVKHVMNITDVGHLTDDGDEGEDKMIKGARDRGLSVEEIAEFFTQAFFKDIDRLNILRPDISCKATDHIEDMVALVKRLEDRGFTYSAGGNVYFDTSLLNDYGRLALLDQQHLQPGARVGVDGNKKNPGDFVLWFTQGKFKNQAMLWDSPWGQGYPGWHLECSAMSSRYLGDRFDIHTGGIDHIPIHHTNEIAQSEAALGHKWVNYWLHNEFIIMKTGKMAKSSGHFITLDSLLDEGYDALDYRYFLVGGHYRSQLVFSSSSLDGARSSRKALLNRIRALGREGKPAAGEWGPETTARLEAFSTHLADDLKVPRALAELWGLIKDESIPPQERLGGALVMDKVLGLSLDKALEKEEAPAEARLEELLKERDQARKEKDWARADAVREELAEAGWQVVDGPQGSYLEKKS